MEYTKDVILHVGYGQAHNKTKMRVKYLNKLMEAVGRHKIFSTIVSITLMLIALDFILITSFMQVLGNL